METGSMTSKQIIHDADAQTYINKLQKQNKDLDDLLTNVTNNTKDKNLKHALDVI